MAASVCAFGLATAAAQTSPEPAASPAASIPEPAGAGQSTTPRGAWTRFLEAARSDQLDTAAQYLQLGPETQDRGQELARKLRIVVDRRLRVDLSELSADPKGHIEDGLAPGQDLVGTVAGRFGPLPILLERSTGPEGVPVWKVAGSTVRQIDPLYQEFGYGPLEALLPEPFFRLSFLSLELWQWLGLIALIVIAYLASLIITLFLKPVISRLIRRGDELAEAEAGERILGPIRFTIALGLFAIGIVGLRLPLQARDLLNGAVKGLVILGGAWLAFRAIDIGTRIIEQRLLNRGRIVATAVLPLGRRVAKVFIGILAFLGLLQNLGFNVTGIIAGLGVGGLAVALAAQKTIEHLFGGVSLVVDQPVRVGDFCKFGDMVGTVEDIGLRSTRIRTLDRTVVTVPNASFSSMQLENYTRRDRMRLFTVLDIRYETSPDQLRFLLIRLRELLIGHPKVHPDPARARFIGFGESSLRIEIFAYIMTSDWNEFMAIREDILLRMMDIVAESGSGFAFPSQTLYLGRDAGLDGERQKAAVERVERLRSERTLPLPQYPPERVAELQHGLDYPPEGSATRGRG